MIPQNIIDQLKRDESLSLVPYKDSVGIWTIGYGHNLEAHGWQIPQKITQEEADLYLEEDKSTAETGLFLHLPWTKELDNVRQGVLINMTFNLGIGALMKFSTTLGLIKRGYYKTASVTMLASKWATQVGKRAVRLSTQLRTGVWQ